MCHTKMVEEDRLDAESFFSKTEILFKFLVVGDFGVGNDNVHPSYFTDLLKLHLRSLFQEKRPSSEDTHKVST